MGNATFYRPRQVFRRPIRNSTTPHDDQRTLTALGVLLESTRKHREQRREKHFRRQCHPGLLSPMAIIISLRPRGTSPFTNTADLHFRPSLLRFPFAVCPRLRSSRTPRIKCFDTSLRLLSGPGLLRRAIDAPLSLMLTLRLPLARSRPRAQREIWPLWPIL